MYCRHCGKEIEKDSKFCPYCGMEVTKGKVEETIPEAGEKQQQKIQGKKKNSVGHVLKRFIVGTFAAVGILVVALAIVVMAYPTDDVEEQNGKTVAELSVTPTPTVTPAPVATNTPVPAATDTPASAATNTPVPAATNTPAPTATNTPVPTATATPKPTATNTPTPEPTKVPAIEDMELEVSVGQIEVGETSEEIKVKVIENGFTGDWTLTYSIEDNTIAKCRWGEWEADNVSPLFVGARGKGETTIKVSIKDTEIYKEIKVICDVSTLPHEPSKEDIELVPSAKTVEVGEYPEIVYIDVYRYGYTDSFSLSFYSDDVTIADAKWDTGTKENDLIIFTKKEGETTIHVYVVGTKNVVADIKVISNGASLRVTPTPEATATPKPTVTPEATATPKPTEKPAATATPTPTASSGSTSSYTATDSSGTLEMSVKPGFASTVTRETKYAGAAETAKLLLPDLEAWSEGKFVRSEVTEHDTYTVLYYHAPTLNKEDSMAMLEKYYEFLENYDIYTNVTTTSYLSTGYYEWQDMDYTGNVSITENAATSYDELPCDLSGWYSYEGFGDIAYGIEYPKEIGFGDTGERYGGTQASVEKTETLQNTSMPEYTVTESGLDSFKITGWGWDATDYVEICLHPDLYEKGDVFTLKEFAAQADAGSGKLNSFTVRSVHIGRKDWLYENVISPNKEHKHMFDSIRVEIVEKSETVTVIHYAVKLRNAYGDDYVLEGLFAVKTGEETPASSSSSERESVSVGIGEVRCTSCRGTGVRENSCIRCRSKGEIDCSYCSGDGEVDCTKCGGDGRVWDALNGENTRCSSCYGSGDKRCTKCNGTGDVDCTSCGGKGYTESQCPICLGKGKY